MAAKIDLQEVEDDHEAFDKLEKSFHKVIQDLVSDSRLDGFREEYEKLYAMLTQSHANNQELIDKCKQMNNSILSNANKVSSVLALSQNDQRAIAGLRTEFEKAWKMVEMSQEREEKSREVIESMKQEVANMTRVVQQGNTSEVTQKSSLTQVKEATEEIEQEIKLQNEQKEKLEQELAEVKGMLSENRKIVDELKTERDSLNVEIDKATLAARELSKGITESTKQIRQVKDEMKGYQSQHDRICEQIAASQEVIERLKTEEYDEWRNVKSAEEDIRANEQQVKLKQKVLIERQKACDKSYEDIDKRTKQAKEQEAKYQELIKKFEQVKADIETNKQLTSDLTQYKQYLDEDKSTLRQAVNDHGNEIWKLTNKNAATNLEIRSATIAANRKVAIQRQLKVDVGQETAATEAMARQARDVTCELITMKGYAQNQKSKIDSLYTEANQYESKATTAKNNSDQIQSDIKSQDRMMTKMTKQLNKKREQQRRQEVMTEDIQNERDLACRLLDRAHKDNAAAENENQALGMVLHRLKEEMRKTDELCVQVHLEQQKTAIKVRQLVKDVRVIQQDIKDMDDVIAETKNRISRAMYLIQEGEADAEKQRKVLQDMKASVLVVDKRTVARQAEVDMLCDKVKVIKSLIERGSEAYETQIDIIESREDELAHELERQKQLMKDASHLRALRLEIIRIEKSLVQEQGKCKALEEELEKPLNVHRWRLLDGTNPEMAQMIKMQAGLRDRLMRQMNRLQKLKLVRNAVDQKLAVQERHLRNAYGNNYQEEFRQLVSILKDKKKILAQMEGQASTQRVVLSERRDNLMNVRTMVREEKSELYDTQKRVVRIRAKTATGTRPTGRQIRPTTPCPSDTKFVGGGFAVGGTVISQFPKPDRRQIQTRQGPKPEFILPLKVLTKREENTSRNAKRLPRGWNPNRTPLAPFLDTGRLNV